MKITAHAICSILIAFPLSATVQVPGAAALVDTDGDTVADGSDNCVNQPNSTQRDTDGDGFGNRCDADLDNSGFVNFADLAIFRARFGTADADADFNDSGGAVNFADLAILRALFGHAPGPSGGCSANAVAAENCRFDGVVDRSVWDVPGYQAATPCYLPPCLPAYPYPFPFPGIEGFSTQFSVAPGETVVFKVDNGVGGTPHLPFTGDVYRLGWYRGAGARRVAQLQIPDQQQTQPACATKCIGSAASCPAMETFVDCSNWSPSTQWAVPSNAVSGVYLAKFTKQNGDAGHVIFVVREGQAASPADLLYQLDDQTWQAYNDGGAEYGDWLYTDKYPVNGTDGPRAASFNRPFRNRYETADTTRDYGARHFFFELDLPLVAFLERNGFPVAYAGSPDLDAHPELLAGRKVYVAAGHDEYWTGERRDAVETAVAAGTHLLFLGAQHNTNKTRWQAVPEIDPRRVVVAYKWETALVDPRRNQDDWTGMWRDTRTDQTWTRPATQPARPENALSGTTTAAAAYDGAALVVPPSMAGQRFWRNTCAGTLGCDLGDRNVGFEYDIRADRYYEVHTPQQPAGLFSVAATPMTRPLNSLDFAQLLYGVKAQEDVADYALPRLTSEATLHRKPSGALVFAASTMRWSWGLDSARNDGNTGHSSRAIQQATINVLADMGVQPAFLRKDPTNVSDPELVRASFSTDVTAPTSHIAGLDPANGVITGNATDVGGVIAGVEVSFDAGTTWHGANLMQSAATTAWSYASVVPGSVGALVRAVDDSGNLEAAHGGDSPIPPSSGAAVFSIAGSPAWAQATVNSFTAAAGWTSLVPLNLDGTSGTDLLSYNAVTGQADYSYAVTGPPCLTGVWCAQQIASSVAATPGWTLVVPLDLNLDSRTDLLSYNAATGVSDYSVAAPAAGCPTGVWCNQVVLPFIPAAVLPGQPVPPTPEHSAGWTSIVPMNLDATGGTDLVWYAAATGLAEYTVGDSTGCTLSGPPVYCRQNAVAIAHAALGWTAVVPLDLNGDGRTDLLSYNAATGQADYSVARSTNCANGVYCWQEIVGTTYMAPGFTTIVPLDLNSDGRTDLLFHNVTTGQNVYTIASSAGCAPGIYCAQSVVDVQSTAGWNLVVPVRLDSNSLTDLISYR